MSNIIVKLSRRLASVLVAASLASLEPAQAAGEGVGTSPAQAGASLAYAAHTESLYKSDSRALYRSEDGGETWVEVTLPDSSDDGQIAAVAVSAAGQGALYVAGPAMGVLKSIDAGESWTRLDEGLPSLNVIALATHSTLPDTLYAVMAEEGIYRSEDGGKSWRMVDKGPQAPVRRIIHADMEGSMQTGFMFAATENGVYRAMDCFCGWRLAGNSPDNVSAIAFNPNEPAELYVASGQQIFRTTNGGEEWQPIESPGGEITTLFHSRAGVLYALLAGGQIVESRDKGGQWE